MSSEELKNIENFKIYNEYGEVLYLNPVNLLGIDLDKECTIKHKLIELQDHEGIKRRCCLYGLKINGANQLDEYKNKLKEINGIFVKYDESNGNLIWDINQ